MCCDVVACAPTVHDADFIFVVVLEVGARLLSEQAFRAVTMVDGLPRACKWLVETENSFSSRRVILGL